MPDLYEIDGQTLRLHFHPGQWRAWESARRFVAIIAGTQSGKTSFEPVWLWREIQRCGPGDYGFISPTFTLMEAKALPEFRKLFETLLQLGEYRSAPVRKFVFSPGGARRIFGRVPDVPTNVLFGYAENPDSLESSTLKAAVLDEAGQKQFKRESWEAILRRLSLSQGRVLIGTTPYGAFGWLRTEIFDRWKAKDPTIDVIQFPSIANPAFPRAEYDRAKATLPGWKFNLFHRGMLTRPAGLIYDSFDPDRHVVPRFAVHPKWPRYLGLDFGGVNTAGLFFAAEPGTQKLYAYREYKAGGRNAAEHAYYLLQGEPTVPQCVGGSKSEDQWRSEFKAGGLVNGQRVPGLPVREPACTEVEVGIDRVYGAHKRDEIFVFDDLTMYLDEKQSYAREVDAAGQPTEKIEDKSSFHLLDAERYIISWLRPTGTRGRPAAGGDRGPATQFQPRGTPRANPAAGWVPR